MGLLEYEAMPSFRDVAHDDVCVHLVIDQFQTGASAWCGPSRQAAWTVHHLQNHTLLGHSPPVSQASRRVGKAL
jgi:hypothetical protein